MAKPKLFLLDAYALIYRSYFAFIKNPRVNSKGMNTSAAFGFMNVLTELLNKENPDHVAVVFDVSAPTFRHEMYKEYKANREEMPEELRSNIPYIRELIKAMNIPIIEQKGYEADDVIGTLAKKLEPNGVEVFMMTPDKDYGQLVSDGIKMYKPKRFGQGIDILGINEINEKYGLERPEQLIDVMALWGDSSDNIPGAPGIGEKTAKKLIGQYGSVEELYAHIDELKGKQKEKLIENKDQVMLSKKLVTINTEVPIEQDYSDLERKEINEEALEKIFNELEFRNLKKRLMPDRAAQNDTQGSLFDMSETKVETDDFENIQTVETDYKLIISKKETEEFAELLSQQTAFCFDTETTSAEPLKANLVGMSFSWKKGSAYYVSIKGNELKENEIVNLFKPILEDDSKNIIAQNAKYDMLVMRQFDISLGNNLFDTMIAHYLIQPELPHNIDSIAERYLNYKKVTTESLIGKKGKGQMSMGQLNPEKVKDYACEDADITWQLKPLLEKQLKDFKLDRLFNEVEMPLIHVLADMEYYGVTIDSNALKNIAAQLRNELIALEQKIHEYAGMEFNIASPKQLGEVLFEKLKITDKPKRTKTKQYATGEDVLEKLADKHEIVPAILEFRGLSKLLNTYVEALPKLVNDKTGRIHTSYNQAVTSTGRLSSTNPNLQNIPIRDEKGKIIRKAFIPRDDEHVLLAADYSQIELRIMAHLSQDEAMLEAFKNDEDIHLSTAAKLFKLKPEDVTREQRGQAKGVNFGIIYGISAFGLSQNTGMSNKDAKQLIDNYFETYPNVKAFMDKSIATAREKGYAETLMGRKRFLPDINSNNRTVRSAAERNAINAPIQGSSADMIKVAMVRINRALKEKQLKSRMIMQVHDEVIVDTHKNEVDEVKSIVLEAMENAISLKVKMKVDLNTGNDWLEAH
ncbi:DNA polymerase I [Salinivirga cyanobacteriivorans]|uniref:DNA polymerase I n=1 Tax=Salinivirga cyanobacteriivorans TaxID=1307839 RepID=A0A0S2I022_9BACT|nr:DNA polymerase I [Salinivirga cyanobacteriivorans]ALO15633.1 DNA polymerase I [Salinivirga cyanobacteriivorans]